VRRALARSRAEILRPLLFALDERLDRAARLAVDPVELPRLYLDKGDQEVAGLVAVSLAYGRAGLFKPVVRSVLEAMGPSPASFSEAFARAPEPGLFAGAVYRFNRPADLAALVAAIGSVRLRHGSLGARFGALYREHGESGRSSLRSALADLARELREAPPVRPILRGARRPDRGLKHLLPDASGPGASKRLHLYLRWMIRGPEAVDLGSWAKEGVPRSALLVPLDTHLHRVSRCLGLTRRTQAGFRTAEEVTAALAEIDPADPVRFDFALCHLGMSGLCPARLDVGACLRCPLAPACRFGLSAGGGAPRTRNATDGRSSPRRRRASPRAAPAR